MEIVPLDESLLIEVQISPRDVAFIRPGQKANVKLSAYDYTVYGVISGNVERISADSSTDEDKQSFYRVIVRTKSNQIGPPEAQLSIIPWHDCICGYPDRGSHYLELPAETGAKNRRRGVQGALVHDFDKKSDRWPDPCSARKGCDST